MKLAIMQPYLFPYIGYFQLMNAVDEFVVYDNIQFTKKGWINRNRILVNGKDDYISLPLKKDSDFLDVRQRQLAENWHSDRRKMINKIKESYRKAPFYEHAFGIIEGILLFEDNNLFNFIYNSIEQLRNHLRIKTALIVSSNLKIDHSLKSQDKVIEICKARNATTYINPIGGLPLYSKGDFMKEGIELKFIKPDDVIYKQYDNDFLPWLSIIDVVMFNSDEQIAELLNLNTLQSV